MTRSTLLLTATLLLATTAAGQPTGGIAGRVVDEGAQPVAGAQIELRPGSRRVDEYLTANKGLLEKPGKSAA